MPWKSSIRPRLGAAQCSCWPPECSSKDALWLKGSISRPNQSPAIQTARQARRFSRRRGSARTTLQLVCTTYCLLAHYGTHLLNVRSSSNMCQHIQGLHSYIMGWLYSGLFGTTLCSANTCPFIREKDFFFKLSSFQIYISSLCSPSSLRDTHILFFTIPFI